jgi:epoxyqueuosine reductase QueG
MERVQNFQRVKSFFSQRLAEIGYHGVIGAAAFRKVRNGLSPVQRSRLADLCGEQFESLQKDGSIISVGIAYPGHVIDCIDVRRGDGSVDRDAWNVYAKEYHRLNWFLNEISGDLVNAFGGISVHATVEGIAVENVEEHYGKTVSHRVVAENAGVGWRGKNELIVNEKFSCALRFASVITSLPLVHRRKTGFSCGNCVACLEACPFLRNKDRLKDYRESCRRCIVQLGLEGEVCGKCIKACYRNSTVRSRFRLT